MNRRRFGQVLSSAMAGIVAGSVLWANEKKLDVKDKPDKHICKGRNDCKGKGSCKSADSGCAGKNSCKGKGGCATVRHECRCRNECKGMGGCSCGDSGCAGKNSCTSQGGCAVPVTDDRPCKTCRRGKCSAS
jgi:hypothetical protein